MKTVFNLPDNEARDYVKKYAYLSFGIAVVSLFIFGWLALVAAGVAVAAFILTFHKANKDRKDLMKLRLMSGFALIVSVAAIVSTATRIFSS